MTPDEQAIHDIVKHLETTWNEGDVRRYMEPFAEDITFIQIFGGQLDGRAAVEGSHRAIFDTIYKGSRVEFIVRSIRFLREDVAIAFTRSSLFHADGRTPPIETRPTLILVRNDGRWQIAAFQNTRISEMPDAAGAARRFAT